MKCFICEEEYPDNPAKIACRVKMRDKEDIFNIIHVQKDGKIYRLCPKCVRTVLISKKMTDNDSNFEFIDAYIDG